jgi:hypothetical protein
MNAGATLGATSGAGTTFSGGLSTSTGTTTTSGGSGTADGDVGWGPPLLVVGGVFLVYALGGWTTRLIGGTAGAGLRRRGRVRGR